MSKKSRPEILSSKLRGEWRNISEWPLDSDSPYGRFFINTSKLRDWMNTEEEDAGQLKTNFQHVCDAVVEDPPLFYKANPEQILVFSILHMDQRGHLLPAFSQAGIFDHLLSDNSLDLNLLCEELERSGKLRGQDSELQKIVREFDDLRWMFCPAEITLSLDVIRELHPKQPLPFLAVGKVNHRHAGGQGSVFQVAAAADLVLKEKETCRPRTLALGGVECHQFAIKTFSRDQKEAFEKEVEAYRGLVKLHGFVRCFGFFRNQYQTTTSEHTYFIILELALYDLFQYFECCPQPITPTDIIRELRKMARLAETLAKLHGFQYQNESYYGWHGDIKPENILCVDKQWVLGDFGFSKFQKADLSMPAKRGNNRATVTYGAPDLAEYDIKRETSEIGQWMDVWSFGCVLSVMVTWIIAGFQGIEDFAALRRRARNEKGDAFHDSSQVLPEILTWHRHLIRSRRKLDNVSEKILELVEKRLLVGDPDKQMKSSEVHRELERILDGAESDPEQEEIVVASYRRQLSEEDHIYSHRRGDKERSMPFSVQSRLNSSGLRTLSPYTGLPTVDNLSNALIDSLPFQVPTVGSSSPSTIIGISSKQETGTLCNCSTDRTGPNLSPRRDSDEKLRQIFLDICELGERRKVSLEMILDSHPDFINQPNSHGGTPILLAAKSGQIVHVEQLLQHPATDLKSKDKSRRTLLHCTVMGCSKLQQPWESSRLLNLVLENLRKNDLLSEMLDQKDELQETALRYCVKNGETDLVETLIQSGANEINDGHVLGAFLRIAVSSDYFRMARLLLRHYAGYEWGKIYREARTDRMKELLELHRDGKLS